ncbi:MAG: hypothetical protein PHE21_01335 [Candidatus Dojkabacteria bacterium]|nr:hypothetical protein [Candidatus Dojkabacteria bacterium]
MKRINTYKALGFVEALIAIMVVGVSSVVLMQIAVSTMQGVIQNEKIDSMTQYAVEGSEVVKEVAKKEKESGDDLFPGPIVEETCYIPDRINYSFVKDSQDTFLSYQQAERDIYKESAILSTDPEDMANDYFLIFCIQPYSLGDTYVSGNIIVGERNYDGNITKGNNVKDYIYFTVVNL